VETKSEKNQKVKYILTASSSLPKVLLQLEENDGIWYRAKIISFIRVLPVICNRISNASIKLGLLNLSYRPYRTA